MYINVRILDTFIWYWFNLADMKEDETQAKEIFNPCSLFHFGLALVKALNGFLQRRRCTTIKSCPLVENHNEIRLRFSRNHERRIWICIRDAFYTHFFVFVVLTVFLEKWMAAWVRNFSFFFDLKVSRWSLWCRRCMKFVNAEILKIDM